MCTVRLFSRRQVIVAKTLEDLSAMLSKGAIALNGAAFGQGTDQS
jgi:hypothetical protein